MDITQEVLTTFNDDSDLLKKVITGDESWVYGNGIETNHPNESSTKCEGFAHCFLRLQWGLVS